MTAGADEAARARVDAIYRAESRRVLATLIRLLGDFDLAEEALQDAFAAAVERWPREGAPANQQQSNGTQSESAHVQALQFLPLSPEHG